MKKFKPHYYFIILALIMLVVGGFFLFKNIGLSTQSVNPTIPSTEKLLSDSSINHDRIESLKFTLVTVCDSVPKCDDEVINVNAGEYTLASFNPSDCTKNGGVSIVEPVSKEFVTSVSGSILVGVSELEANGGCNKAEVTDVKVVERQQCNVDSDCSFTKSSNVLRSSNGKCQSNRCYYSVASTPSDIPSNNIISNKPLFSFWFIIILLVILLIFIVYKKFFRK